MISITSAIIGRKVFEEESIPIFKLIRFLANFRWNHEICSAGFENIFFKIFRDLIDKVISRKNSIEYDPFTHKFVSIKEDQKGCLYQMDTLSNITREPFNL